MPNVTPDPGHSTRNYMAHGGNELVIGGKLTLLPSAVVDDPSGLLGGSGAAAKAIPYQAPSEASTVAALREDFNALLTSLIAAGIMKPKPAVESTDE